MKDGRRIYLLAKGRLVNLAAAEGPSLRGHGHVVRQPVPLAGAAGARGQVPGEEGVHDRPERRTRRLPP